MKLRGEITSVEDHGDCIAVEALVGDVSGAGWRGSTAARFRIRNTVHSRRSLRIGRRLDITIEVKP